MGLDFQSPTPRTTYPSTAQSTNATISGSAGTKFAPNHPPSGFRAVSLSFPPPPSLSSPGAT